MDKDNKFDLRMGEMLREAEVKAPAGVWDAVSSRLDDIDGVVVPRRRYAGWIWAASSLAAAALALFLVFRMSSGSVEPVGELTARVESTGVPEASAETSVETSAEPATVIETTIASAELSEAAAAPVEDAPSAPVAPSVPSTPASSATPSAPGAEQFTDPFASLEEDKPRKSGGVDLMLGGSIEGNESAAGITKSYTSGLFAMAARDRIIENSASTYGIPFTVGVGVRFNFNRKLSLGTGVDYSLLTRSFAGSYIPAGKTSPTLQGDVRHTMHYIGIPVSLYYNVLETSLLRLYAHAGGEIEWCIASSYRMVSSAQEISVSEKVTRPLFSAGAGIGVEFRISPLVAIYIDPGAYYYFYSGQPKSMRTERPFNFNFDAGLRFNLGSR